MGKQHALLITPKTRVGDLLEVYPSLEPVLMDLAPVFKKLQNPVLRRTVGKVAGQEEIFLLITPFIPAPIIELISKKGYDHYCMNINDELYNTYFYRNQK